MSRHVLVYLSLCVACGASATLAQTQSQPQVDYTPVYTICTLLVGTNMPGAESGGVVVTLSGSKLSTLEAAESVENLADLQEKLKATFRLDQLAVISSYGDMMSPGREMVLEGAGSNAKLVVTGQGVTETAPTPVTVHRGDGTSYTTTKAATKYAGYSLLLTSGTSVALQKPWSVTLGTRTILARQVQLNGPIYFIVIATPIPGTPMKTSIGIESQAYRVYSDATSGRGSAGVGAGEGKGMGVAYGAAAGASGSGGAQGVGVGTTQMKATAPGTVRAPKLLYSIQPTLSPEARAAGLKGSVVLSGSIAPDGTVQNISVVKGVEGLNDLAIAAFKQWRYEAPPLDESGRAVTIQVSVQFTFVQEP